MSTLTRKYYKAIASGFKNSKPESYDYDCGFTFNPAIRVWKDTCLAVAHELRIENSKFNLDIFLLACNFEGDY